MTRRLRIAILAHSTNPRGGVVHALALGEALTALGHHAVVHAPDESARGFFREAACATVLVPATKAGISLHDLVATRVADYCRHFEQPNNRGFDIYHAQDGISGNALATLFERGVLETGFARTVHHIDSFADPRVAALQVRSITAANTHFAVSRLWRDHLAASWGIGATIVGNGVDTASFTPQPDGREPLLRMRLGLGDDPVLLAVGGVEERKNTLRILRAFRLLKQRVPQARLVIAGGVSLLDHSAYQRAFAEELAGMEAGRDVVLAGRIAQADMPALFRVSAALVFPSLNEGFGLVALEALACGRPAVVSRIAPFTEVFGPHDVLWCDPFEEASIADAILAVLDPAAARRVAARAGTVLARHSWNAVAEAHLPAYRRLARACSKEPAHA